MLSKCYQISQQSFNLDLIWGTTVGFVAPAALAPRAVVVAPLAAAWQVLGWWPERWEHHLGSFLFRSYVCYLLNHVKPATFWRYLRVWQGVSIPKYWGLGGLRWMAIAVTKYCGKNLVQTQGNIGYSSCETHCHMVCNHTSTCCKFLPWYPWSFQATYKVTRSKGVPLFQLFSTPPLLAKAPSSNITAAVRWLNITQPPGTCQDCTQGTCGPIWAASAGARPFVIFHSRVLSPDPAWKNTRRSIGMACFHGPWDIPAACKGNKMWLSSTAQTAKTHHIGSYHHQHPSISATHHVVIPKTDIRSFWGEFCY